MSFVSNLSVLQVADDFLDISTPLKQLSEAALAPPGMNAILSDLRFAHTWRLCQRFSKYLGTHSMASYGSVPK